MTNLSTKELILTAPVPEETRTYKPVPHSQVIDVVGEGIIKAGYQIKRELYMATDDASIATGRYFIGMVGDNEMELQIAWQNSYNKSKKLTFSIGANVLVCTNGMMGYRSAGSFKGKHVGNIQTLAPDMMLEYIKHTAEMFSLLQEDREAMKQIEVDRRLAAELVGRMYLEEKFLESTQLNILKREFNKPTHDYNSKGSLWELYQYTTFAIGGIHPSRWMEDHLEAHDFFVNVMGELKSYAPNDIPIRIEDKRQLRLFDDELGEV